MGSVKEDRCGVEQQDVPEYTSSEPCFSCDECRNYDGNGRKRSQWRDACHRYTEAAKIVETKERAAQDMALRKAREAEELAQRLRATFKVIEGSSKGEGAGIQQKGGQENGI